MKFSTGSLGSFVQARSLALLTSAVMAAVVPAHASAASPQPEARTSPDCDSHDGLHFICGPVMSEDVIGVPGAPFLIASGMSLQGHGHLYLIDLRTRHIDTLFSGATPAAKPEDGDSCSVPPDENHGSYAGLSVRRDADGAIHIFAANNSRHSIEGFLFDARSHQLRWESCVKFPEGGFPNGVIALPDGGLLATSFFDSRDKDSQLRMERGEATGAVLEWHPGDAALAPARGFPAIAGANGIEVSADGQTAYVDAWSVRKLLIISRTDGKVRELPLDFLPDNVHRLDDGTLLVAGQRATVKSLHQCGPGECPQQWEIAHVDPTRGTVEKVVDGAGDDLVNYSCGAVMADGKLYFTARGADRLVYIPTNQVHAQSAPVQSPPNS